MLPSSAATRAFLFQAVSNRGRTTTNVLCRVLAEGRLLPAGVLVSDHLPPEFSLRNARLGVWGVAVGAPPSLGGAQNTPGGGGRQGAEGRAASCEKEEDRCAGQVWGRKGLVSCVHCPWTLVASLCFLLLLVAQTSGLSPRGRRGCYLSQAQCVLAVLGGSPATLGPQHSACFLCQLFPETLEVWVPSGLGRQAPALEDSRGQGQHQTAGSHSLCSPLLGRFCGWIRTSRPLCPSPQPAEAVTGSGAALGPLRSQTARPSLPGHRSQGVRAHASGLHGFEGGSPF